MLRADTPAAIDALLMQMMAKNAAERPAAAAIRATLKVSAGRFRAGEFP
jgi:hypothetical protein